MTLAACCRVPSKESNCSALSASPLAYRLVEALGWQPELHVTGANLDAEYFKGGGWALAFSWFDGHAQVGADAKCGGQG